MSGKEHTEQAALVQDYKLEAAPEKVWRAISTPQLREHWLPSGDFFSIEQLDSQEHQEISYRLREASPPYLESMVTFRLFAADNNSTRLTITHKLGDMTARLPMHVANSNTPSMRAA